MAKFRRREALKSITGLTLSELRSLATLRSDPVDMEAAETGFNLSATGRAGELWPDFLIDYSLTEQVHNGRPVYRNSDGWDLYSQEDIVGYSTPMMRSTTTAVKPHLCQHWQYRYYDDGFKYKPGDITVTLIFNIPKLECVNV